MPDVQQQVQIIPCMVNQTRATRQLISRFHCSSPLEPNFNTQKKQHKIPREKSQICKLHDVSNANDVGVTNAKLKN